MWMVMPIFWNCNVYNNMAFIEIYDVRTRYEKCLMDMALKFSCPKIDVLWLCVLKCYNITRNLCQPLCTTQNGRLRQIFPFKYHVVCWPLNRRSKLCLSFVFLFSVLLQKLSQIHQSQCYINAVHRFIPCSLN